MEHKVKSIFFFFALIQCECLVAQNDKTTIVFVCEHGAARSAIASAYFNKLAQEKGLPYHSVFRALSHDSTLTRETKQGLTNDGFATDNLKPIDLAPGDVSNNTFMITLDCVAPARYEIRYAWTGIPPISSDYQAARNEILKHVNELITELKNRK